MKKTGTEWQKMTSLTKQLDKDLPQTTISTPWPPTPKKQGQHQRDQPIQLHPSQRKKDNRDLKETEGGIHPWNHQGRQSPPYTPRGGGEITAKEINNLVNNNNNQAQQSIKVTGNFPASNQKTQQRRQNTAQYFENLYQAREGRPQYAEWINEINKKQ